MKLRIFLLLALSPLVKEDFVIPVGATGLWLLTQRGRRLWGAGAIAAALFWTFFVLKIYYPYILNVNYFHYGRYELFAPTFSQTLHNAGAMIGRTATVVETIDAARESGCVRLDGVEWTAVTADGAVVEKGARVVIEKMESIVLTVRKV